MEDSEKCSKIINSSYSVASFDIKGFPLESVPSPTLRRTRRNALTSSSLHLINSKRGKSPSYRHLETCIDWYEDHCTSFRKETQKDEARRVRDSITRRHNPLQYNVQSPIKIKTSHRKVPLQAENEIFRLGKNVKGNVEMDKSARRSWSLKQYEVKGNDRRAEKTTYCRPVTNQVTELFNKEYIYKTMENKKRLQGLVRKLAMARDMEKQKTAWDNYIQELRVKHRAIDDGPQPTTSRAPEVQDDMERMEDFYETRFNSMQSNYCKHLLDDIYNTDKLTDCSYRGTQTLLISTNVDTDKDNAPHRAVCYQLNPYLGLTNNNSKSRSSSPYVCFPTSSKWQCCRYRGSSNLDSPNLRRNSQQQNSYITRGQNNNISRGRNSNISRGQNSNITKSQNSNITKSQNNRTGRNYGAGQNYSASKNNRAAQNYGNNLVGQNSRADLNFVPCENNCAGTIYRGGVICVPKESKADRHFKSTQTNQRSNSNSVRTENSDSSDEEIKSLHTQSLDSIKDEYEKISKKLTELKEDIRQQKMSTERTQQCIENRTCQLKNSDGRFSGKEKRQMQTKSDESLKKDYTKVSDSGRARLKEKEEDSKQKLTNDQRVLESIEKKLDILINKMNDLMEKRKPGDDEEQNKINQQDEYKPTGEKKTNYKCNLDQCVSDRCMARKKLVEEEHEKDIEQRKKEKQSDYRVTFVHLPDVHNQDAPYNNGRKEQDFLSHHNLKDKNTAYANQTEQKSFWINNWENDSENNDHFGFRHDDRYVCRRVTDNSILPFSERYLKGDKIDDILIEEQDKSDQAKRDIEDILNGESARPFGVQIEVDIPTRERCTEVTDSLSQTKLTELLVPMETAQLAERMTIAINTDPLSLLTLLRISTDTIRRMLSYVHFDYYSLLPLPRPMRSNESYQFNCDICEASFNAQAQLRQHTRLHELDNTREPRDCCVCRHMLEVRRNRHPNVFKCRYCGKTFTRAYCCELHEQNCAKTRGQQSDIPEALAILR